MFSLLSGALLPINAAITLTSPAFFEQFQAALRRDQRSDPS